MKRYSFFFIDAQPFKVNDTKYMEEYFILNSSYISCSLMDENF